MVSRKAYKFELVKVWVAEQYLQWIRDSSCFHHDWRIHADLQGPGSKDACLLILGHVLSRDAFLIRLLRLTLTYLNLDTTLFFLPLSINDLLYI
jgi:hypothetical protein